MDSAEHRHYTGVSNQHILENLEFIASSGQHLVVRVPLIPGITAKRENIDAISRFVAGLGRDVPLELLNFNPLAESKYRSLGISYKFASFLAPLPAEEVTSLKALVIDNGCHAI